MLRIKRLVGTLPLQHRSLTQIPRKPRTRMRHARLPIHPIAAKTQWFPALRLDSSIHAECNERDHRSMRRRANNSSRTHNIPCHLGCALQYARNPSSWG
jgi:hypothetical protein